MTGADPRPKIFAPRGAPFGAALALSFVVAAALSAAPAQAQFLRSWGWHPDEGPPPIPPDDIGRPPPPTWRARVPANEPPPGWHVGPEGVPEPSPISVAEIRHKASTAGFRLLGTPHLKGRVYVAFGEDAHGSLHHLAYDAYEGRLVENEAAEATAKESPHPAIATPAAGTAATGATAVAPAAPTPQPAPAPAAKTAATAPNAAPKDNAVTARELSPIEPQPGIKHVSPGDPDIDKD